ncbi:MAG: VWA domain-containing protein [Verrucomicrobia bacterium]|nr:VWA domain-containing protein [Verrucomicrobiota bacterium]
MADGEKAWGTRVVAIEARFLELGGGGTGGGGGQFWSEHSASGEERPGLREGRVISPSLDDFPMLRPNTFQRVNDHPLSTFSIDVDTASYSVVRSFLNQGTLPPRDAVRVEEMINYFPYDYAPPADGTPFSSSMEVAACPWNANHLLLRIGLKGREIPMEERPPLNLVYLIDVSGSMRSPNRLPLVKRALTALAHQLDERDQVAIVVYAGATGLVLPSTSGADTQAILDAINGLEARGSTAGSAGIQLAYKTALEQFREGEVNRVILCTDGDFNVGITHRGDLERFIEEKAESGVSLTVLGFGMGNIKDSTLEILSNKGNGNYAYIDDFNEARKVLVDQMLGTLVTIAKDVKIQVEFNPATVAGYRLIGYENRILQKEDFNNDEVDAGDIGAGHTVTAFYELVPAGQPVPDAPPEVDPLRYQVEPPTVRENEEELLTLKLRYKEPEGDASKLLTFPLGLDAVPEDWDGQHTPSPDFQFASAVAAYGMVLRDPAFAKSMPWERILSLAESAKGDDPHGYRTEFIRLIRNAMALPRTEGE